VAVDGVEQSLAIVDMVREHFPNARIIARARNVGHLYQLLDRKVEFIERELFESSLRSARSVLEAIGWPAHEAREDAMRFRRRNIELMLETYPHYKGDRAQLIAVAKKGRQQFQEQMAREREERRQRSGANWDRDKVEAERLP